MESSSVAKGVFKEPSSKDFTSLSN